MSSPRDRFDDRDESGGWQEPAHLSGSDEGRSDGDLPADRRDDVGPAEDRPGVGDPDGPNFADRRQRPRDDQWPPPGWDLPAAERDVPAAERDVPAAERDVSAAGRDVPPAGWDAPDPEQRQEPAQEGSGGPPPGLPGRATRPPNEFQQTFTYQGDLVGTQAWAVQHGWTVSEGTAPEDEPLRELIASAPASRVSKDHRPAGVIRGRADALDLVAFDVAYADRRGLVPQYAITAAPLLVPVPYFRLSPARFWKHRTGGLVRIESGDPAFDARWVLLAAEDSPGVRRLAGDATVRQLLLGTDDGDEFWSAASHVAAIRPDGHRPQLVEHHARMLTAVVRAVAGAF